MDISRVNHPNNQPQKDEDHQAQNTINNSDHYNTDNQEQVDFPFKPVADATPPDKQQANIDVADYESVRHSQQIDEEDDHRQRHPRPALIFSLIAVVCIAAGFAGGFFTFKYRAKIASLFSITADTNTPSTENNNIASPKSLASEPSSVSAWPTYVNDQFTLKYPDTWYGKNLQDRAATNATFYSSDPAKDLSKAYKVDVLLQSANGQDLLTWITAANTASGHSDLTPIATKVGAISAFQQTITGPTKQTSTYLLIGSQVLTLTYSAPEASYNTGLSLYTQILNSLSI